MTIDDAVKQIEAAEALLAAGGGAVVDIAAVSVLKDAYIVELKETQERLDKLEADVKRGRQILGDAVDAWVPCKYKDVKDGETLRKGGQEYKKTAKVIGGQTVSEWGDKAWFFKDDATVEVLRRVVPVGNPAKVTFKDLKPGDKFRFIYERGVSDVYLKGATHSFRRYNADGSLTCYERAMNQHAEVIPVV